VPPGVDPSHQRVRSASVVLPPDDPWIETTRDVLSVSVGVGHTTV
jgi:phthalate 4,5-dioxygenase